MLFEYTHCNNKGMNTSFTSLIWVLDRFAVNIPHKLRYVCSTLWNDFEEWYFMLFGTQRPVEGIRDRLYGFVKFCPKQVDGSEKGEVKTDMAMDISFGSSGYALVLARAFKTVCQYYQVSVQNTCIISVAQLVPNIYFESSKPL